MFFYQFLHFYPLNTKACSPKLTKLFDPDYEMQVYELHQALVMDVCLVQYNLQYKGFYPIQTSLAFRLCGTQWPKKYLHRQCEKRL